MSYKCIIVLGALFIAVGVTGCSGLEDRRTIWKSKRVLAARNKDIEELTEIRGRLRRIIEMKVTAAQLLESTDRVLGRKYLEIGSYNLALESFKEAEYVNPNSAFVKKELGECYYLLGRSAVEQQEKDGYYSLSRKYYKAAIAIRPEFPAARYGYGLLLFFAYGDVYGAIEQMKQILSIEPENIEAHFALGRFYYEIGDLGKSLGEYLALNRILPKDSPKRDQVEENILRINRELGANG